NKGVFMKDKILEIINNHSHIYNGMFVITGGKGKLADDLEELFNNSSQLEPPVIKKNGGQLALITKERTPHIIIMSKDEKDFEQAIETMYWNKKGLKPKSEEWTKEDMLKDYKKVKLYIEEIG